jgi:hypothetical protein
MDAALTWRRDAWQHRAAAGYSTEDDYQARYGSYAGEHESVDVLTTWSWGASYSDDDIEPTEAEVFGRVPFAQRDSLSLSGGVTRVLNRNAVVQSGVSVARQSGFLSDPYKQVWVAEFLLPDQRPQERRMVAWTTRLRQFIESSRAALHVDGRLFYDSWNIASLTLEGSWKQPLGAGWELSPSIRYYSQKSPGFYAPYFFSLPPDALVSSDYRLATYGALSFRLSANYRSESWEISLGTEHYASDASWALFGSLQDTPALVEFWRFTLGLRVDL